MFDGRSPQNGFRNTEHWLSHINVLRSGSVLGSLSKNNLHYGPMGSFVNGVENWTLLYSSHGATDSRTNFHSKEQPLKLPAQVQRPYWRESVLRLWTEFVCLLSCRAQCWGWQRETPSTTTAGTLRWIPWMRTRACKSFISRVSAWNSSEAQSCFSSTPVSVCSLKWHTREWRQSLS